jgi:manganese/zinc/iron transport system ATP- binding protein
MRVVASGPTSETFTRENLQKTYGGKLNLLDDVAQALKNVGRT